MKMLISKKQKDNWILAIMLLLIAIIFTSIFFGRYIIMGIALVIFFSTIFLENWLNDRFLEAGILFDNEESCSQEVEI